MKHKVVSGSNLPARFPITLTIAAWLLMDRLHSPGWVYGVVWTILAVLWIAAIAARGWFEQPTDIWPEGK